MLLENNPLILYSLRETWSNNNKYFKNFNNQTQQHGNWTSDKVFNKSMLAYTVAIQESDERKEERKKHLVARQQKLRERLTEENANFQAELKQLGTNDKGSVHSIGLAKERIEQIRSVREDERKKLAAEKLYENWRLNNPHLREIESKKMQQSAVDKWQDQVKEKEEAELRVKSEQEEYARHLEIESRNAKRVELQIQQIKLNRELELKEILKQQMMEIKMREGETELLQSEEAELTNEKVRLALADEQRKEIAERNKRRDYGQQLLRQHKAKLRMRAKQVQEALEFDFKLLQSIKEANEKQKDVDAARKDRARQEAERIMQVLSQQMRLEKEREVSD